MFVAVLAVVVVLGRCGLGATNKLTKTQKVGVQHKMYTQHRLSGETCARSES